MIRATFSAEKNKLSFGLPECWPDLSQRELAMVFRAMERNPEPTQARLAILLHLTGLELSFMEVNGWRVKVRAISEGKDTTVSFILPKETMAWMIEQLDWMSTPGIVPVRLQEVISHGWSRVTALPADMHGVKFSTYLVAENCFQGVMMSQSEDAIQQLATTLYPGLKRKLEKWEQLMVLQWWAQVKGMFADLFPHFFKPSGADAVDTPDMRNIMDNQIRALTGGDITKEKEVLAMDTWRALTELEAKAKEAEEFKKSMKK